MKNKNLEKKIIITAPKKIWLMAGLIILGIVVSFLFLFFYPQFLFRWSVRVDNLSLYSDQAFLPTDGRKLLEQVQFKLSASPMYSTQDPYAIFICNTPWRRMLFFLGDLQAGGRAYYYPITNVFLSGAVIEDNRLIAPSGKPDFLGRRLDHFIAHEIAHVLTSKVTSWGRYHDLPQWIKEGYAEYIGSRGVFNYEETVDAFQRGDTKMSTPVAVPYLRYNLLVAYLLDERKWGPRELFETSLSQAEVEAMLKTEMLNASGHQF
jgi:hypothetical protein